MEFRVKGLLEVWVQVFTFFSVLGVGAWGLGFGFWVLGVGCLLSEGVVEEEVLHHRVHVARRPLPATRESSFLTTYWSESTQSSR